MQIRNKLKCKRNGTESLLKAGKIDASSSKKMGLRISSSASHRQHVPSSSRRKFMLVFQVLLLLFSSPKAAAAAASSDDEPPIKPSRKRRLGLMTASFPWTFGPYQQQMYQLSLLLKSDYDVCWMSFSPNVALPPGEYKLPSDITKYQSSKLHKQLPNLIPPPDHYQLDHITFLGRLDTSKYAPNQSPKGGTASYLNGIASQHSLNYLITLMDITRLIPDVPFQLPVVGWVPLHSATVKRSSSDYWSLRHYHGIASLAPSSARAIKDAVGEYVHYDSDGVRRNDDALQLASLAFGKAAVQFIPHIIDRSAIVSSAQRGLELLSAMSVAHADSVLSGKPPIFDRGQERTLESGHERSIFGNIAGSGNNGNISTCRLNRQAIDSDTFVVLLQGGNYDGHEDRKGWDTSVQAFMTFYNMLPERSVDNFVGSECASNVHLLIHSMESYLIEADANQDTDAPAMVLPQGHLLHKLLHETGLPRSTYTLDLSKHEPDIVSAYKTRASVCLHPSKVEGLGMNAVECQAVGTNVITTYYTAMGDYTKLGRAISPLQTIKTPTGLYEMAMPDVSGIANALMELYEDHNSMKKSQTAKSEQEMDIKMTNKWIDTTFSKSSVSSKFRSLLGHAEKEYTQRSNALKQIEDTESIPAAGGYQLASGYHTPIADWDAPWTLLSTDNLVVTKSPALHRICWEATLFHSQTNLMVLPARTEGSTGAENGVMNENTSFLVKTYVITALQGRASRRISLVALAMQQATNQKVLPDGLATQRSQERSIQKDEL